MNYVKHNKVARLLAEHPKTITTINRVATEYDIERAAGSLLLTVREPGASLEPLYKTLRDEIYYPASKVFKRFDELEHEIKQTLENL